MSDLETKETEFGTETSHPSFGSISLTKTEGSFQLFGSAVHHNHALHLTISRAVNVRRLHADVRFTRENLISVYLSPLQLSELLFSIGKSEGVPCTLDRVRTKDGYVSCGCPPITDTKEQYVKEFKKDMAEIVDRVSDIKKELVDFAEGNPNKTQRRKLASDVNMVLSSIVSNLPFVLEQFVEKVEKVTNEAKGELEARKDAIIRELGTKSIDQSATPFLLDERQA